MSKINLGRVILGGLAAGIVLAILESIVEGVFLAGQWGVAMKALGKPEAMSVKQIVAYNVLSLGIGIVAVWLYAAMRPRFGPGPKTALLAGFTLWLAAYAIPSAPLAFQHIFPLGLELIDIAIGLAVVLIATVAGACVYKEA
jgi:hypothetical protein